MKEVILNSLAAHSAVIRAIEADLPETVAAAAETICHSLSNGGKLLVMGNGGSAADSQHFAAELVGRFLMERKALPAISLSTDTSALTALGNDYAFDIVFRRQVEALAAKGDVLVGISTSGNSSNVLEALKLGRQIGCTTIGLLGKDGGTIRQACDIPIIIPSHETPRIQEGHITIIHIICDLIERRLFGGAR